jgi:hypothetical protein
MSKIDQLQEQFQAVHSESLAIGKQYAESIDMLSLGEVKETIAKSIVEMESLVNRKTSFLERLPWAGKHLAKARDSAKTQSLQSGSMVETVDRLFNTLSKKNDNVMQVMQRIFKIREHVKNYVKVLSVQEAEIENYLDTAGDTFEAQRAKNLLVQVKPSIVKARDRMAVMTGTLNSAAVATQTISGMLPSLQGELQTELAINASMNELKEFKDIFDATLDLVEELNYSNNKQIQETLLEVNQLSIQSPRNLKRLEQNQIERQQMNAKLEAQTIQAKQEQDKSLARLSELQKSQTLSLSHMNKEDM